MRRLAKFVRPLGAHLAVALVLSLLYLGGAMEFLELRLFDLRFELNKRDAGEDIVLVAIDNGSLKELDVWPWPRTVHAEMLDRIVQAGARVVAYNVDFSSASFPAADARLEESLAGAGEKVILPAFVQTARSGNGGVSMSYTSPLPVLARHSAIASVNFIPGADGFIRESHAEVAWRSGVLPSMAALMSGREREIPERFFIDYGIDGESFARVSFADILYGRADPGQLSGKIVIVGATAAELADNFPTPQGAAVPGTVLHALAAESILRDRTMSRVPPLAGLAGIFLAIFAFTPFCSLQPWQRSLAGTIGIVLAVFFAALGVQIVLPLLIDVVPWIISVLAAFGLGVTRLLNIQTLDLLAQKLTITRKEAFVQGLVDRAFDAVISVDEGGTVRSVNHSGTEMFDLDAEKLTGRCIGDFLELGSQSDAGGFLASAAGNDTAIEVAALRGDGTNFTASMAVTRVPGDDGHSLFVVLLLDVTALRKAQAETRDIRQRLTDSLESISEGIALWDGNDRLLTCNAMFLDFHVAAAHMLTPGSLFGDFVRDSVMLGAPPDAQGREREWIARRIEHHRKPGGRFLQQTSDGRWLRTVERHTGNGEIICVEADVTEDLARTDEIAAARDAAEVASRAKSAFLANASHELRTPLNAILGFSQVIRDGALGPSAADRHPDYADDIHKCGTDLLRMIDDMLELSRIDSGADKLDECDVSLPELVADCRRSLEASHEGIGSRLIVELPPGLPNVRADRLKLERCLLHLLSNAEGFSDKDGGITVSAEMDPAGGIRISVTDKGRGISAEQINRVVEPFDRTDDPMIGGRPGLGLGLTLANMLARQHGGSLDLVSKIGEGTSATICLPPSRVLSGPADSGAGAVA